MGEEEVIKKCVELLDKIIEDMTVPRNIRRTATQVKNELLSGKESLAVRATSAISTLEELTNDPNMPLHARTTIWSIVSQLETVAVEK
ncbi:MAG TPA: UPF0147 family protein [Methanomicrobia archaeon]|mgnify:CR=1 FL=1|nr:UPF0147 family protein [Candidatus Alkanophaga volatiphilum]HDO63784.1 UPF0147 family protein [Methanomicrobia archaeon]HEX59377.1 UPF0147 family protein [Methanomicrobia archaeon]